MGAVIDRKGVGSPTSVSGVYGKSKSPKSGLCGRLEEEESVGLALGEQVGFRREERRGRELWVEGFHGSRGSGK